MARYAKVDKTTGLVISVSDNDQRPQVSDNERQRFDYVQIKEGANVKPGEPVPPEATQQPAA